MKNNHEGERTMEETLAGVVAELERVVRPLGFRIKSVEEIERSSLVIGDTSGADNDPKLSIIIVRKGKLG
jgi:hypothetical protein